MIKLDVSKNLMNRNPKFLRQSLSLKKNMISFPIQTEESSNVICRSFINKRVSSPSKLLSERLKTKVQRQNYVQTYLVIMQNHQKLISRQRTQSPQFLMKRSNSHKIQISKNFQTSNNSPSQRMKKKITISSKTLETDNPLKTQNYESFTDLTQTISSKMNHVQRLGNKHRYDLQNFYRKNKNQDLFTCKSLKKCSQIDFYNHQMSTLLNKNVQNSQQTEKHDDCDQTSFNVVLQKIKNMNNPEVPESAFQMKKHQQKTKIMMINKGFSNSGFELAKQSNIFHSPQARKKLNFKSALEWSAQRVDLMKSPLFKTDKNIIIDKKKSKKEQEEIEGWVK